MKILTVKKFKEALKTMLQCGFDVLMEPETYIYKESVFEVVFLKDDIAIGYITVDSKFDLALFF